MAWQTLGGDTEKLTVLDKRHVEDAKGMFEAITDQLELHVITVFRQRRTGMVDLRVKNRFFLQVINSRSVSYLLSKHTIL